METKTLTKLYSARTALILTGAFFLVLLACTFNAPAGDFGNYYFGAYFLTKGQAGIWLYEPYQFNLAIYALDYPHLFLCYTPVPPFSLPAYALFALIPLPAAKLCWNIGSILLFVYALWKLLHRFNIDRRWILPICLVLYMPLRSNLYLGQSYLLIFFLLAEGLMVYEKGRKWSAALLWSLAFHLKLFPGIVLLFLLFRRDWRTSGWFLLNTLALLLFTTLVTGWETAYQYFTEIMPRLAGGEINNTFAVNYQSAQVWLRNLLVYDAMHNPDAPYPAPVLYIMLSAAFKGLVLWVAIAMQHRFTSILQSFSVWIFAMLLLSGYGSTYGLVLLIFPVLALSLHRQSRYIVALLLFTAILMNIPMARLYATPVLSYTRLWLLLGLFIWFCLRFRPVFTIPSAIFPVVAAVYLAAGGLYRQERTRNSAAYFLKHEEALLVYDYKIQSDSLLLSVFDDKGPSQKHIPLSFTVTHAEAVNPAQYLPTEDYKARTRNAYMVNDSLILFLSDRNRGVGFYTLRYRTLP